LKTDAGVTGEDRVVRVGFGATPTEAFERLRDE
jgi:hypothetical protein